MNMLELQSNTTGELEVSKIWSDRCPGNFEHAMEATYPDVPWSAMTKEWKTSGCLTRERAAVWFGITEIAFKELNAHHVRRLTTLNNVEYQKLMISERIF